MIPDRPDDLPTAALGQLPCPDRAPVFMPAVGVVKRPTRRLEPVVVGDDVSIDVGEHFTCSPISGSLLPPGAGGVIVAELDGVE